LIIFKASLVIKISKGPVESQIFWNNDHGDEILLVFYIKETKVNEKKMVSIS
jgi:hypothetical protein